MRIVVIFALALLALNAAAGCTPVRYDGRLAHGAPGDPNGSSPADDAGTGTNPMQDAASVPGHDAGRSTPPPNDAWVMPQPGTDAWVAPQPDAWVAPQPDAYVMPNCPTYTTNVQPIYRMHCASCHTTGGNAHFGSSYTIANQSTSGCGTSMADCTLQLGQPGGSMSGNDPYGGFSTTEMQTIQSWIDCGRPR